MVSKATKEMVWTLHEMDNMKKAHIARKLGISRQSVYDILSDENYKNRHLTDTVKKMIKESNESLLKGLQEDSRPRQIIDKILTITNDENILNQELAKPNGFRNLMGALKVMVDTSAVSSREIRETEKAEQEKILNETEAMNDNFENAMVQAVTKLDGIDFDGLIEEDSMEQLDVQEVQ